MVLESDLTIFNQSEIKLKINQQTNGPIKGLEIFKKNSNRESPGSGGPRATSHQTHEMTVPNEIIGCVIGKGGSKIAEIR